MQAPIAKCVSESMKYLIPVSLFLKVHFPDYFLQSIAPYKDPPA
jgi:hypothetical protein